MTEKEYYTYQHRDINGYIFYVGCATTNPEKRGVRAKLGRAYSTFGHCELWDRISDRGYSVEILKKFSNRQDAFDHERELIAKYRNEGELLVNIQHGGAGAVGMKDTDEIRKKKSITKIGKLNPMYGITGSNHPASRPVIHKNAGVFFNSVQEAAEHYGYKMKTLYNILSGIRTNNTPLEFA